jgi:hypothetical protein
MSSFVIMQHQQQQNCPNMSKLFMQKSETRNVRIVTILQQSAVILLLTSKKCMRKSVTRNLCTAHSYYLSSNIKAVHEKIDCIGIMQQQRPHCNYAGSRPT